MLDRDAILRLIPHQGTMCLLDRVIAWSETELEARAVSHLDPANPLRRDGMLPATAGIEYGLQAGALHGALRDKVAHGPGLLAGLREVRLMTERLDDPGFGALLINAQVLTRQAHGLLLAFAVHAQDGRPLLDGRAAVVFGAAA